VSEGPSIHGVLQSKNAGGGEFSGVLILEWVKGATAVLLGNGVEAFLKVEWG